MIVEERDGGPERRTLIACVTRDDFLARVSSKLGKAPFQSRWGNLVWGWCKSHYTKYKKAPGDTLAVLYEKWSKKESGESELQKVMARFLSLLSDEYKRSEEEPLDYLLDQAEEHLNGVALLKLKEEMSLCLDRGDVKEALSLREAFLPLNLKSPPIINLMEDSAWQKQTLLSRQNVLIKMPGKAGEFFGDEFSEDSFVGVLASPKAGKSWTLLNLAWHAVRQGQNVAYFQVGDLSPAQISRRFHIRAALRPIKPRLVLYPTGITLVESSGERITQLSHEERTYEKELTWKTLEKAYQKALSKYKGRILFSHHPIRTISAVGIQGILSHWDREGTSPKVVVIDYAGNLAPIDHKMGPVDQIDHTWSILRQISEVRKCLVITAQQGNKESFRSWVLTRNNFSGSKMILAHVTSFLGVNVTDEEKRQGVLRYNFLVRREEQFSETFCLYCGSCLDVGNPMVVSTLPERR